MQLKDVFIQNLKNFRVQRGFTQAEFAEKCDTATSYIGQIEIGDRFPSMKLIEKFAEVLQIKPHLLFFNESDDVSDEQLIKKEAEAISNDMKIKLTNRLTEAVRKIVENID